MRIVDRNTFLKMPKGTLFMKYSPCSFGELCIKDGSIFHDSGGNDFYYNSVTDTVDSPDSSELFDKLLAAQEDSSISIPMDFDTYQRDGLFDYDQLFAVYEMKDVCGLIDKLFEVKKGHTDAGGDDSTDH